MSDNPTFSFLIPTYRRIDSLTVTLDHLEPYASDDCEVVVVDDCTPGDAIEALCKARGFPRYIRLDQNLGVTGARRVGYAQLKGRYLISLDDDSYPITPDFLNAVKAAFVAHPDAGGLALNILTGDGRHSIPRDSKAVHSASYIACGVVWTREMYERVGAYSPVILWQGEEMEHSMRIMGAGFTLINCPDIVIKHDESPIERNIASRVSHDVANSLKRGLMLAPAMMLPREILRFLAVVALRSRQLDLRMLMAELFHRERGLVRALKIRRPISLESYNRFYRLRRNDRHNTYLGRLLGAKQAPIAVSPQQA
jgi:glycosyltransferase involved in cell wall biosynthesis